MFNLSPKLALAIIISVVIAGAGVAGYFLYNKTIKQATDIGKMVVTNQTNVNTINQTDQSNKVTDAVVAQNTAAEQNAQKNNNDVNNFINNGVNAVNQQFDANQTQTDMINPGQTTDTTNTVITPSKPDTPHQNTPTHVVKPVVHKSHTNADRERAISEIRITGMWMAYCNNTTGAAGCPAANS